MLGNETKFWLPFSKMLYRQLAIQSKSPIHWNQDSQALLCTAALHPQSANHLSCKTAAADKAVVESLSENLYLPQLLLPQIHAPVTFQNNRPPAASYAARGRCILTQAVPAWQSKADSNGIVYHCHLGLIQMTHMLTQTAFINGADLFQKDN